MVKTKKHRKHSKYSKYSKQSKRSKQGKQGKQKHKSQKGGVGSKTTSRLDDKVNDVAVALAQVLSRTSVQTTNRNLVEPGVVAHILKDIPRDPIRRAILDAKRKELKDLNALLPVAEEKDKPALQDRIRDLHAEVTQLTWDEQRAKSIKRVQSLVMPPRTPRTPRS